MEVFDLSEENELDTYMSKVKNLTGCPGWIGWFFLYIASCGGYYFGGNGLVFIPFEAFIL